MADRSAIISASRIAVLSTAAICVLAQFVLWHLSARNGGRPESFSSASGNGENPWAGEETGPLESLTVPAQWLTWKEFASWKYQQSLRNDGSSWRTTPTTTPREVDRRVVGPREVFSEVAWRLARQLRERRLLIVWLFDASSTASPEAKLVPQYFGVLYNELGLFRKAKPAARPFHLSTVASVGTKLCLHTAKPEHDALALEQAVAQIETEFAKWEQIWDAASELLARQREHAENGQRQLILLIVTEKPFDGRAVPMLSAEKWERPPIVYLVTSDEVRQLEGKIAPK